MKGKSLFFKILSLAAILLLFSCASSKNIQRVDGPDDYYESESSTQTNQSAGQENQPAKNEDKSDSAKSAVQQTPKPPSPQAQQSKPDNSKNSKVKNEPAAETPPPPVKIEENPLPQEIQDEMGDDNWAKDESKVRIRKKDKDKIKDSSPDDDKWGKD
ncbi:MAG: hypothetical protein N3B13_03590 [Deltaproteobacteria bacterium]|nr:hypothetical protein [Deltaproteobacteria bacterium]